MKDLSVWHRMVFGAPEDDVVAQMAVAFLREKKYSTTSFRLWEEYHDGILVAFFTPENPQLVRRCRLRCASYEFLNEAVILVTPLVIGCHQEATRQAGFKEAVITIADAYCRWALMGFPIYLNNGFFPPWGGKEPTGWRRKLYTTWLKEVNEYLVKA